MSTSIIGTPYPYDFSSVKGLPNEEKLSIIEYLNGEPLPDLGKESKAVLCRVLAVRDIEGDPKFLPKELWPDNWE